MERPGSHPRAASLATRGRLVEAYRAGVACENGLIAQGRGEAFDYLLGEKTLPFAERAARAAAALLLSAEMSVISVNGNAAGLAAADLVALSRVSGAALEVNLFYRSEERVQAVKRALEKAGARNVLGANPADEARIPELESERRRVDRNGIAAADVVLLALEDGDRTKALKRMGKKVIAIDLNPLSVTARSADVTIVDNVVRAIPLITALVEQLKGAGRKELERIAGAYDNAAALAEAEAALRRGVRE